MLKLALKLQRELRLAITIDVSIPLFINIHLFSNFLPALLVHEEFGPSFAWMGNAVALKAKLQEIGYDGDGDMAVGGVIAAEVTVRLTGVETMMLHCCAEFESSSVWRSSFQNKAIH